MHVLQAGLLSVRDLQPDEHRNCLFVYT